MNTTIARIVASTITISVLLTSPIHAQSTKIGGAASSHMTADVAALNSGERIEVFSHHTVQAKKNNTGTPFLVSLTTGNQVYPRVSPLGASGFIAVWTDANATPYRIKYSINDGTNWVTQDKPVPALATDPSHTMANVLGLPSGEVIIAYTTGATAGNLPGNIYVQLVDNSGTAIGSAIKAGETGVNGAQGFQPTLTSVAGGFVVGWTEREYSPDRMTAHLRSYDVASSVVTPSSGVLSFNKFNRLSSSAPSFSSWKDGFATSYVTSDGPMSDIRVSFFRKSGIVTSTPLASYVAAQDILSLGSHNDISTNAGGQVIVTWHDAKDSQYDQGAHYAPVKKDNNGKIAVDGKGNIAEGLSSYWVRVSRKTGLNSSPREILLPAPGGISSAVGRQTGPRVSSFSDCGFVLTWFDWSADKTTVASRQYYERIVKQDQCPEFGGNASLDVGIEKKIIPDPGGNPALGEYQIVVTNNGSTTIPAKTGVKIVDTVPSGLFVHGKPKITHPWVCEKGGNFQGTKVLLSNNWKAGHATQSRKFTCVVETKKALNPGDAFPMFKVDWEGQSPADNIAEVEIIESDGSGGLKIVPDSDSSDNLANAAY